MPTREFRVLKTLGGCGGTIIARALAASGAVVLSEVNPRAAQLFAGALNPLLQVTRTYPELLPSQWRGVDPCTLGKPEVFGAFAADVCDLSDQPVVIRDYSYIDYIGTPFVWPKPSLASLDAALLPYGSIRSMILVRRPSASLRSLLRHSPLANTLSPEEYFSGHIDFIRRNPDVPILRFEDFFEDRIAWMKSVCLYLSLPYEPNWLQHLASAPPLTGNMEAIQSSTITDYNETMDVEDFIPARLEPEYRELLHLCGY